MPPHPLEIFRFFGNRSLFYPISAPACLEENWVLHRDWAERKAHERLLNILDDGENRERITVPKFDLFWKN